MLAFFNPNDNQEPKPIMEPTSFSIEKSLEILERTPGVLCQLLDGLSEDWKMVNEGKDTWSPYDIVGHLIHGEKTDWIPRMEIILSSSNNKTFKPFDRFAQFENSKGKTLNQLLKEFTLLRAENISKLKNHDCNKWDLQKTGNHPALGETTLQQLIATWVVHDLNHIAQIARVMANQYKNEVGPWIEYLKILNIN